MILVKDINHPIRRWRIHPSCRRGNSRAIGLFAILKYEMKYIYFSSSQEEGISVAGEVVVLK